MELAREAAPEIDRLVLSVNGIASTRLDEQLLGPARELGLESLEMLPHYADFLLAGALTRQVAKLRLRYQPPERIDARLDELVRLGLVDWDGQRLTAAEPLRPVLEGLLSNRATAAAELWSGHPDEVAAGTEHARRVSQAASPDHEVAAAHREVPEPDDPYLALYTVLTNLRYVRQHDHAAAWSARGLTARAMVPMTALWHGNPVDADADGVYELVEAGYATLHPVALTEAGRQVRDAIEEETNRRAQASFDALDEAEGRDFLDALRALPGGGS